MSGNNNIPRASGVAEKQGRWAKIHLFAGGLLFTGFAKILVDMGVVEKLFADENPDSLVLGAGLLTAMLFVVGWFLTKLMFKKVEGLPVSAKVIKYAKTGWVVFVLVAYGVLNVFVSANNVTEARAEKSYEHAMAVQEPPPAKACDVLRSCAFSKYPYLDDGISTAPVIADAVIASCRNEYEVCADSILLDAGADLGLLQDKEMREGVLQKVKRDWIVPMILAARVRK